MSCRPAEAPAIGPSIPWHRAWALAITGVVYGVWGTPAPPSFGWPEATVGWTLLIGFGLSPCVALATGAMVLRRRLTGDQWIGAAAFHGLLWIPLAVGAAKGWAPDDIVRDVVPLFFLFLPVVATLGCAGDRRIAAAAVRALDAGLVAAGVALTLRWWLAAEWGFGAVGTRLMAPGDGYLLNAPAVVYAIVRLGAWTLAGLGRPRGRGMPTRPAWATAAAASGSLLGLGALAGNVHRSAIAAAAIGLSLILGWCSRRSIRPLAVVLIAAAALAAMLPDGMILGVLTRLIEKTVAFGWNERDRELAAVLEVVTGSVPSFLVGEGWGALFANPAVGGWQVSYTHNLISYLLLKTGALGIVAASAYLLTLTAPALALARRDVSLATAAGAGLFGGLLLHTSFKFLDFGLLLALVALAGRCDPNQGGQVHPGAIAP